MRTQRIRAILALGACLLGPADQGQADVPASLGQIEPFTDAYTVAVVQIDVDAIEVDRWLDMALEMIPGERAKVAEALDPHARVVRTWVQQCVEAGAREIYGIVSLSYVAHLGTEPPVVLVVPVANGGAVERVQALVGEVARAWKADSWVADGCVVVAAPGVKRALQSTVERQVPKAMRMAFASAPPGVVQAVVMPYPEVGRILSEMLPTLPATFGGGSSAVLGHDWSWATASLKSPPDAALQVVLQFEDPPGASAAATMIGRGLAALGGWRPVRERLSNWDAIQEALVPLVVNDTLQLRLGQTRMMELIQGASMPAARDAKARALRVAVMNNLKQIALALIMCAYDQQNRLPVHLADALPYLGSVQVLLLPEASVVIPSDLQQQSREAQVAWLDEHAAFSYRLPGALIHTLERPARTVLAYQKLETGIDGWVGAAFADGHVEILTREALEQLLK